MNYRDKYTTIKRSTSVSVSILDTSDESDVIDMEAEYRSYKIYCEDISGMPVGGTLQPYAGGFPCYDALGNIIELSVPTDGFSWQINFSAGHRKLSWKLSAPATADVLLSITAYDMVED